MNEFDYNRRIRELDYATDERKAEMAAFANKKQTPLELLWETVTGVGFLIFCGLLLACVYVGGVGYGVGSFFYYAFVTTCHMPFEFHTMYQCAMIPFLNMFMFVIAVWIVAIKFAFIAICWIAVTFFSWVPAWIIKIIGK